MSKKIVVGLGNPGSRYAATRHNVGFMAVDALAAAHGASVNRKQHQSLCAELRLGPVALFLMKPQTFMNRSGEAVAAAARWFKTEPENVIAIYDDMDLAPGRLRLRPHGGAGGHNGMKSIIAALGTDRFPRIRIGIGRPLPEWKPEDWVLAPPFPEEQPLLAAAVQRAAEAAAVAVRSGWNRAMDQFNSPDTGVPG